MVATSFETQEVVDPSAVASGSMTPLDQEASGTLTPPETPNREDMSDTMSIGMKIIRIYFVVSTLQVLCFGQSYIFHITYYKMCKYCYYSTGMVI